jgi:hypothetical protein
LLADKTVRNWNHFYGSVAARHISPERDKVRGEYNTAAQILQRGLTELQPSAIQTIVDLIDNNTLYRGAEHSVTVKNFQKMQKKFAKLTSEDDRNRFVCWVI